MGRRVFFSFHFNPDCHRAAQIRNMGIVDGNHPATDNDWEQVKRGGAPAVRRWIDRQLYGKSCAIVLIGAQTAGRKWINYEIEAAWSKGMGVLGIYVHKLKNLEGRGSPRGANPFSRFQLDNNWNTRFASVAKAYDPPFYLDSKGTYAHIKRHLPTWIEHAIDVRASYPPDLAVRPYRIRLI